MILIMAAVELGLDILQDSGIACLSEGRLEGEDNLSEVVVLALKGLDDALELARLSLEAEAGMVVGVLELLDHILELL